MKKQLTSTENKSTGLRDPKSDDFDADYGGDAEDEEYGTGSVPEDEEGMEWEEMEKDLENEDKKAAMKRKFGSASGYESDDEPSAAVRRPPVGGAPRPVPGVRKNPRL